MLSVVIPTAGRGKVLAVALRSILDECRMVGSRTEVIVIDNNIDEELEYRRYRRPHLHQDRGLSSQMHTLKVDATT